MNLLRIEKSKLKKVVLSTKAEGKHCLLIEQLLATIWSYRKQEDGMYYSNDQLADLFYSSESTIKRALKLIKNTGLVDTKRRYNNSSIIKPSKKFYIMMKEKGHGDPSRKVMVTSYTPSKEGEIETTKKDLSFETDPSFEKRLLDYRKQGYSDQTIERYYEVFKGPMETK